MPAKQIRLKRAAAERLLHAAICALRRAGYRVWRKGRQHTVDGTPVDSGVILMMARSYGQEKKS